MTDTPTRDNVPRDSIDSLARNAIYQTCNLSQEPITHAITQILRELSFVFILFIFKLTSDVCYSRN